MKLKNEICVLFFEERFHPRVGLLLNSPNN